MERRAAAVALVTAHPWVAGTLVRQLWSLAGKDEGDDVSQTLVQPFVNYNMADGWYLVSSPIITVNWEADRDNAAVVPVGGGAGRVFTVGGQALTRRRRASTMPSAQTFAPQASLRLQLTFLFPK